ALLQAVKQKRRPNMAKELRRHNQLRFIKELKQHKELYIMLLPFTILFFLFVILPVLSSAVLSFTDYNMLQFPKWRGIDNYVRLFLDDDLFLIAFKNTMQFAIITGPISYMMCFVFAWLINELRPKVRSFVTLVFYAPALTGNVFF